MLAQFRWQKPVEKMRSIVYLGISWKTPPILKIDQNRELDNDA